MSDENFIGRTIAGKFAIEAFVGGGGMGSIYRARQMGLEKTVAIKILHPALVNEPTFAVRFKREAKAASRIDHPNSLRVLDFGQEPDGLLYIAMEYLDGKSLMRVLREEAPLSPARIVDLFRQALAALAVAHDLRIVHRDLKPENIILLPKVDDEGGKRELVKVCDFGIAKFTGNPSSANPLAGGLNRTANAKLTAAGTIIGTPDYMSPEQARGDELDARSDLYSMGVILYEALTGRTPFRGETPLAIVLKHLDAQPERPSAVVAGVDARLEAICLRALQKTPGERFQSAREMRSALGQASQDSIRPAARPAASPAPIPRPAAIPSEAAFTLADSGPALPPIPLIARKPLAPEPRAVDPAAEDSAPRPARARRRMADQVEHPKPSPWLAVMLALAVAAATGATLVWMSRRAPAPAAPSQVRSPP